MAEHQPPLPPVTSSPRVQYFRSCRLLDDELEESPNASFKGIISVQIISIVVGIIERSLSAAVTLQQPGTFFFFFFFKRYQGDSKSTAEGRSIALLSCMRVI